MTTADKVFLNWNLDKTKNLDSNITIAMAMWNNNKDLKDEVPWTLYIHPTDYQLELEQLFNNRFELDVVLDKTIKRKTIKIESA